METWQHMQNVVNYIEDNIDCKMNIAELAQIAALSPFYFQKLFLKLVGKNVMEYVRLRKLANAQTFLDDPALKINEVARRVGIENSETFIRMFKDVYQLTPGEYRKTRPLLTHYVKPELALYRQIASLNHPVVAEDMILEIKSVGLTHDRLFEGVFLKKEAFSSDAPGINHVAEAFASLRKRDAHLCEGVLFDLQQGRLFAGHEVIRRPLFSKLEYQKLPKGYYYVCEFEAETEDILRNVARLKARRYMQENWLPHQGVEKTRCICELFDPKKPGQMSLWYAY